MNIFLLVFIFLSRQSLRIKEIFKGIICVCKLGKETAPILKLNVTTLFNLRVQIGFNLASTPLADIAGEQMAWQISQRVKVASSK